MNEQWKMVPVDPTDDMIVAFAEAWYSKRQCIDDPDMLDAYRDMLTAAPVPPAGDVEVLELRELVIAPYPNSNVEDAHDEYLDDHQAEALWLLKNAGRIETMITRLTAERDGLENELDAAASWDAAQLKVIHGLNDDVARLKSELTKARELLGGSQNTQPTALML